MILIVNILVFIIACLHLWFSALEMYFWTKPFGKKLFKLDDEFAQRSAGLAANQGLYNIFLSAGLFWSLLTHHYLEAVHLQIFFLLCVAAAGIFGAITVSKKIFYFQGAPAIITLILLLCF